MTIRHNLAFWREKAGESGVERTSAITGVGEEETTGWKRIPEREFAADGCGFHRICASGETSSTVTVMDWGVCIGIVLVLAVIGLVFGGVLDFLGDLLSWVVGGLILVGIVICLISIL